MKQSYTQPNARVRTLHFKALLIACFCLSMATTKAQQYTEHFTSAPPLTEYPGVPSWKMTATVTLGGTQYEFGNAGNGGWAFSNNGGLGGSSSLFYTTAATTSVTIRRKDGKRFQFYGAWAKYTNFTGGYNPPWLQVTFEGSEKAPVTYNANSTVAITANENVTGVSLNFQGLWNLNFDEVTVGPAVAIAPLVTTYAIQMPNDTSAALSGEVTDDGGAAVTESGFVYSTSSTPTVADTKLALSTGVSDFSDTLKGLQKSTTYYIRAYAINSVGVSYGALQTFTTFGTFTTAGEHSFNTAWSSAYYKRLPFVKTIEGWDVTGQDNGLSDISVVRLTNGEANEGISSLRVIGENYPRTLGYMSIKTHDATLLNLTSFWFRYDVQDYETSFSSIVVTGYKKGVPVPGAVQSISGIAPLIDDAAWHLFTANEGAFNDVDEFRLSGAGPIGGAAMYSFDIDVIASTPGSVLPVTFTAIKAAAKNEGIQVSWDVALEGDVKQYEIERSVNGTTFAKAGTAFPKANNYGSASYAWLDAGIKTGTSYYRIRSVFNSGHATVSQIVRVSFTDTKGSIEVYPNPATNSFLYVKLNNQPAGIYHVQLFTASGQQLLNTSFSHTGGSASQRIDINTAPKGIYQLKVTGSEKSFSQKVIRN